MLTSIAFTAFLAVFSFAKGFVPNKFERLSYGLVGTFTALLATLLFLKFDKKRFSDIELVSQLDTLIKFLFGIFAGVLLMGLMVFNIFYFSNTSIE